jgi:hypothetical protein
MLYQNPAIQSRVEVHLVEEAKGGPSKLLLSFLFTFNLQLARALLSTPERLHSIMGKLFWLSDEFISKMAFQTRKEQLRFLLECLRHYNNNDDRPLMNIADV